MRDWKEVKNELLFDKSVKKEYERLTPHYAMISEIISARTKKKITQKELAEKIGTKQSAIARLESGTSNPSFGFLEKIAEVLGCKLTIHLS